MISPFDPDAGRRLGDLALQALLEAQERVELHVGEEAAQKDAVVRAADAVDAAVALHDAHRVPGQVVVDDVARLLEVDALGQHVGGEQQVVLVLVCGRRWRVRGARGEAPENVLAVALLPADHGEAATIVGQSLVACAVRVEVLARSSPPCRRSRRRR